MTRLYSAARYSAMASRSNGVGEVFDVGEAADPCIGYIETNNRTPAGSAQEEKWRLCETVDLFPIMLPFVWCVRGGRCIQLSHVFFDHPFGAETGGNRFNALFDNVKPSARNAVEIALIEQWHHFLL